MDKNQAEDSLKIIREVMERSNRYTHLSGISGVIGGLLVLFGCYATLWIHRNGYSNEERGTWAYVVLWSLIFAISLLQDFIHAHIKAKREGSSFFNTATYQLLKAIIPGIFVAFVIGMVSLSQGSIDAAPAILTLGYGCSLCAAGMFTIKEVRIFGVVQLITGTIGLVFFSTPAYSIYFMGLSMGIYHIIFGIWVWIKYRQ